MRQDDAFRAGLLLAYLQGEPKSAAALGDFLEEQGEPRVKPYGDRQHRAQVVLGNLPPRLAHELACDFAERALTEFEQIFPEFPDPRNAVAAKRRWIAGQLEDAELIECRKRAFRLAERFRNGAIGPRPIVRTRRPAFEHYAGIVSPRMLRAERVCQAAGHAASFAAHTTALFAARFSVYQSYHDEIDREHEVHVDMLETSLVSYAYVPSF